MRDVLRHRDARLYIAGQVLSLTGDTTLWLGVGIWVKRLTGSSTAAGLVFFAYAVPYVAAPLLGLLVDRVRRRPLMIVVNLLSALAVLPLLLVHDSGRLWVVYVVMALYGLSGVTLAPAQSALLTVMLPKDLLGDANGVLQTGRELLRLVSPLVGGGVVAAVGTAAPIAVFDAATFVLAAGTLALLRVREQRPHPADQPWLHELTAGARHLWRTLPLRQIVLGISVALLVIGFGETLVFAVVQGLHRSPAFVGVLFAAQGAGAVSGGLTSARALRRFGDGRTLALGLFAFALGSCGLAIPNTAGVLVAGAVAGSGIPWAIVAFTTAIQQRSPAELQGRTYAAADACVSLAQTVSIGVGAALVLVVNYRLLIGVMAAVMFASAAYVATRPDLRPRPLVAAPPAPAGAPPVPADAAFLAAPPPTGE